MASQCFLWQIATPLFGIYQTGVFIIERSALAHQRNRGGAFGSVIQLAAAVVQVLDLEAIGLVFFVIESIQFVNGDLMEAIEVRPPFPAAAEIVVQERICALLAQLGSNIEGTQGQHVDTVAGNGTECCGNRFNNTCVDTGALGSGNVNAHTGTAEDHSTLEFLFGDHGTGTQTDAVEHQLRIVGVGISLHTDIGNGPALALQIFLDCFLQRIAGEVSCHQKLLVFYSFHTYLFLSDCKITRRPTGRILIE